MQRRAEAWAVEASRVPGRGRACPGQRCGLPRSVFSAAPALPAPALRVQPVQMMSWRRRRRSWRRRPAPAASGGASRRSPPAWRAGGAAPRLPRSRRAAPASWCPMMTRMLPRRRRGDGGWAARACWARAPARSRRAAEGGASCDDGCGEAQLPCGIDLPFFSDFLCSLLLSASGRCCLCRSI
jgi:hypothetical protein